MGNPTDVPAAIDVLDEARVVAIDEAAVGYEFYAISAHMGYWGARFADASRAFLLAKARHHAVGAAAGLRIRADGNITMPDGRPVKLTEEAIKQAVICDAAVARAELQFIEAEAEKIRLGTLLEALRTKRDMLVSIGANIRAEMDGNPSIRREARASRSYRDDDGGNIG